MKRIDICAHCSLDILGNFVQIIHNKYGMLVVSLNQTNVWGSKWMVEWVVEWMSEWSMGGWESEWRVCLEPKLRQLRRNDRAMIRWICGIKDRDKTPLASLLQKLSIMDIGPLLSVIIWPCTTAHVLIKSITNFQNPGIRKKGRPPKTWSECVKTDVNECGLAGVDPLDRDAWRAVVFNTACCCQPHRMRQGQHLNQIDMDGWMDGQVDFCKVVL